MAQGTHACCMVWGSVPLQRRLPQPGSGRGCPRPWGRCLGTGGVWGQAVSWDRRDGAGAVTPAGTKLCQPSHPQLRAGTRFQTPPSAPPQRDGGRRGHDPLLGPCPAVPNLPSPQLPTQAPPCPQLGDTAASSGPLALPGLPPAPSQDPPRRPSVATSRDRGFAGCPPPPNRFSQVGFHREHRGRLGPSCLISPGPL